MTRRSNGDAIRCSPFARHSCRAPENIRIPQNCLQAPLQVLVSSFSAVRHTTTRVQALGLRFETPDAFILLRRLHAHPKVMADRAAALDSKNALLREHDTDRHPSILNPVHCAA